MIPYGCLPQMDEGSFKWLQRYLWQAVPGCHGSSQWFKLSTLVRWWILQMYSKMQLTAVPGCHDSSEWLKWHALMLSRFNMTSHSQLTIANSGSSFLPPLDDGSSKWLQRCSWRAVPGRYGGSEWFKWYTLTLSCLDMTFHSKLKIANSGASCVVCTPNRCESFKCIQRCSWRAVPGCHDSSEWLKWHVLTLSRFNMTSHSQLTIANSGSSFLPPLDNGSIKCIQRCSWRTVPGCHDSSNWFKRHTLTLSWLDMTCHS